MELLSTSTIKKEVSAMAPTWEDIKDTFALLSDDDRRRFINYLCVLQDTVDTELLRPLDRQAENQTTT